MATSLGIAPGGSCAEAPAGRVPSGLANVVPDQLSRRYQPASSAESLPWSPPSEVGQATESIPEERVDSYCRSLLLPGEPVKLAKWQ